MIEKYIESWLKQDIKLFSSTLHENVTIMECYGPIYKGKDANVMWFDKWNVKTNIVTDWKILSFSYDSDNDSCSFEWGFSCIFEKKEYSFFGCSFATFKDKLIFTLNEYEMKKEQYLPYNKSNDA